MGGVTTASTQRNRPDAAPGQEDEQSKVVVLEPTLVEPPPSEMSPAEQAPPGQAQAKTPEQLLQELQQRRQLQQQRQMPAPR